jgi:hypothetical protein
MRPLLGAFASVLLLASPGVSRAETHEFGVDGSLRLFFPTLEVMLSAADTGSGTAIVTTATEPIEFTRIQLPAGLFSTAGASQPVGTQFLAGIAGTFRNLAGDFAAAPGVDLFGVMRVPGRFRICVLGSDCGDALGELPVLLSTGENGPSGTNASRTSLVSEAAVGLGGNFVVTLDGEVQANVEAGSWGVSAFVEYSIPETPAGGMTSTVFATGFVRGPGGNASTVAQPGGQLLLVSPIRVSPSISSDLPAFAVLDVTFTEPPTTTTSTTTTTTSTTTTSTTTTTLPGNRVAICHRSEEDGTTQTIRVPSSGLAAHLGHGDTLGACVP